MSNRTKVGDVYLTHATKKGSRLIQLVNIDPLCLNSDVVAVYDSSVTLEMLLQTEVNNLPIEFHTHTSVEPGLKLGLWSKVGNAVVPDIATFLYKNFQEQELIDIGIKEGIHEPGTTEYWDTWTPLEKDWKRIDKLKGERLAAERGYVFPPRDLIYRIENGKSEFKDDF